MALLAAQSRRLGLEGKRPPAPRAPSVLTPRPLPAYLGSLGGGGWRWSGPPPPPCLALTQCPGASGGCIVFEEVFQGRGGQQEMLEDEVCTRTCIEELQVATLELLMGTFREGGLRLSAPPSPINLCPNPPPGCLPCAAPWGSDFVSSGGGWGLTPPLHCPRPSLLPPRPRGQGRGGMAALPPSLRGPLAQPTSGGNGGALPVARAAGLPVCGGALLLLTRVQGF